MHGQYAYLIVFSHPTEETVDRYGLRKPSDFTKAQFKDLVLECHPAHDVEVLDVVTPCCRPDAGAQDPGFFGFCIVG